MRSEILIVGCLAIAATSGCAASTATARCRSVTTLASPVFACAAPIAIAPKPEPQAEPEPEPEQPAPVDPTPTIQFETDKAVLLEESKELLDDVVKMLNEHEEITKIRIEGHTDAVAKRKYNKRLSRARAAAVMKYLIDKGIDPDRLTVKGHGEDDPIADNESDDGRFKNRRVEFTILSGG
jgi:outer membrane protein OmpA-like peptidoglycan-associated protein